MTESAHIVLVVSRECASNTVVLLLKSFHFDIDGSEDGFVVGLKTAGGEVLEFLYNLIEALSSGVGSAEHVERGGVSSLYRR